MMGSKKPIAELVVAPSTVITVPIEVTPQLKAHVTAVKTRVHLRFSDFENLPLPRTSSIESFIGNKQNGEANATTIKMPNKHM